LRLRQSLRRERFTARPLFTRPAWPRRTLRSHGHQRAPRKLSVHVTGWTCYASSTALAAAAGTTTTTMRSPTASAAAAIAAAITMHSPAHGRLRQPLRRQRYRARSLFTRPAWPRRTLRSHDHQRAPRKLSVHAVALCSPCV
jgi:hypothetical protein